jgi:hypothetical protein
VSSNGRLEYWRAKSELCHRKFQEQVTDPTKQDEAVANLARFIEANRQVERLTHGVNYSWIFGGDVA